MTDADIRTQGFGGATFLPISPRHFGPDKVQTVDAIAWSDNVDDGSQD